MLVPSSSTMPRHAVVVDFQAFHAGPQPQFAAQVFELAHQLFENLPHAGQRPCETFEKDAAKHDRELAKVHVVLARPAVELQRAEEHVHQQRILDPLGHD